MTMKRREFLQAASAGVASLAMPSLAMPRPATAQSASRALLVISESGANSVDPHTPGANRGSYEVAWNCYDRLLSFKVEKDANGVDHANAGIPAPELAEEWNETSSSVTFKLRKNATFHNGAPITAKDVKWSLDRAMAAGGNPRFQLSTGSLTRAEQTVAVDDHTFRIDYDRLDPQLLPNLAFSVPNVLNSELIKKNATATDPWGFEWTKNNLAGGGAYQIANRTSDTITFVRFDDWKSGPLPQTERVIWRVVPSPASRRALLERGDADISNEFPPKDVVEMEREGKLNVFATPIDNAVQFVLMNQTVPPFDNVKVRRAIAHAMPYQKIHGRRALQQGQTAVRGISRDQECKVAAAFAVRYGSCEGEIAARRSRPGQRLRDHFLVRRRQCRHSRTDERAHSGKSGADRDQSDAREDFRLQLARQLRQQEAAVSHQSVRRMDQLSQLLFRDGVRKDVDLQLRQLRQRPHDGNREGGAFRARSRQIREMVKQFIKIAFDEVASIPLYQPYTFVATQKRISGYRYWFHRQMDYRTLVKA